MTRIWATWNPGSKCSPTLAGRVRRSRPASRSIHVESYGPCASWKHLDVVELLHYFHEAHVIQWWSALLSPNNGRQGAASISRCSLHWLCTLRNRSTQSRFSMFCVSIRYRPLMSLPPALLSTSSVPAVLWVPCPVRDVFIPSQKGPFSFCRFLTRVLPLFAPFLASNMGTIKAFPRHPPFLSLVYIHYLNEPRG